MKNVMLVAFVFLLRAVYASEPKAAGGFYLSKKPTSVWQACRIMFYTKGFEGLPDLFVVAPLSNEDAELLIKAVSHELDWILNPQGGIWDEWMGALKLHEDDPSRMQYKDLHRYLLGAAGMHMYRQAPIELRALAEGSSYPGEREQGGGIVAYFRSLLSECAFDFLFKLVIFWAIVLR